MLSHIIGSPEEHSSPIPDEHLSSESKNATTCTTSETNTTKQTPIAVSTARNSAGTAQSGSSCNLTPSTTERISKYLIQYVPETPVRKKSVTGQRVLTSAEGLALLKEKEEKKAKKISRNRTEEKRQRKQEEGERKVS